MPKLSVILPAYNAENYIYTSVSSVLNQTFHDFILYVIDDGSTDNTLKILNSFNDPRLKIVRNSRNMGIIYTLNYALSLCGNCEFIARMDADDISKYNRFELQLDFFNDNPNIGILGTSMDYFTNDIRHSFIKRRPSNSKSILSNFFFYNPLFHPTIMFRSNVLENNELYPANFPNYEDYGFWVNLSNKTLFANINTSLLYYRRHQNNITNEYKKDLINDIAVYNSLISRFASIWSINLESEDCTMLSVISNKERFMVFPEYKPTQLVLLHNKIYSNLSLEFDKEYFTYLFLTRGALYFMFHRKYKDLISYLFYFKFKSILLFFKFSFNN